MINCILCCHMVVPFPTQIFSLQYSTGSDIAPQHIPPASLTIWHAIFAGGMAGVVSRTATAPLEKIKILAQVR